MTILIEWELDYAGLNNRGIHSERESGAVFRRSAHALGNTFFLPSVHRHMDLWEHFDPPVSTAVLAEGKFGEPGGKTANGVVLHSDLFAPHVIIDSTRAGSSADDVLDHRDAPAVPIVESVDHAAMLDPDIEALVIGVAPPGGELPPAWIREIERAIEAGWDIVSGLHTFFSSETRWVDLAAQHDVSLFDVRRPPEDLRVADGSVESVDATVILTMGTDCAVGKRTTAYELYSAAIDAGENAAWVATGQTGIMVGAQRGVAIDRVPADFCAGVVEKMIVDLSEEFDLIFVEGQGSLTHRAYAGVSLAILHGAWPNGVVLVTDPDRERRVYFEQWPVAGIEAEIDLIDRLSDARVIGISTWGDPDAVNIPTKPNIPIVNVFAPGGTATLVSAVQSLN